MIPESRVEQALAKLAKTDEQYGELRGTCDGLEYRIKIAEAQGYLNATGTQDERKACARTSEAYRDLTAEYEATKTDYHILQAERKREELVIDVWRSQNATHRRGNI